MKILHLPNNIGGVPAALAECERAHGHDSTVITFRDNPFGYEADRILIGGDESRLKLFFKSLKVFLESRSHYDIYHFNFGASLLHFPRFGMTLSDLPFYDYRARKIFTFSGCDARQKYPTLERLSGTSTNAACFRKDCYGGVCNSGSRDRDRRVAIDKAARHANHFLALNPDLLHFLPQEMTTFCPYVIPGFYSLPKRHGPFCKADTFHIVHAPSNSVAKGSDMICAAVQRLQAEFPGKVRFTKVEGMSRENALKVYATADLLIDQLLIGWYGAVAVEAMKMGVPVACYIADSDLGFVPPAMVADLPIYRVSEGDLFRRLRDLYNERDQLELLSRRSMAYVDKWHDPMEVSRNILNLYRGVKAA